MTREREEFVEALAREPALKGVRVVDLARKLCRLATAHHRLAEVDCNYGLSAVEERKNRRIENQIKALCQSVHIDPIFSGDPRGTTVKLKLPSKRTNDWGNTGWCVPTGGAK